MLGFLPSLLPSSRYPSPSLAPSPPAKLTYPTVTIDFPSTLRGVDADDPLARALVPPPGETSEERERRLHGEAEAQRVSDQIDEALRQERAALKKKKVMKMLLLGQAESGAFRSYTISSYPARVVSRRSSCCIFEQASPLR